MAVFDLKSGNPVDLPEEDVSRPESAGPSEFHGNLDRLISDAPGKVWVNSGYRSNERQAQLYDEAIKKYGSEAAARHNVAPPGHSMHNHDLASDLGFENEDVKKWVHQNAANYGLHFPMGHEPWHVEPIGARRRRGEYQPTPAAEPPLAAGIKLTDDMEFEPLERPKAPEPIKAEEPGLLKRGLSAVKSAVEHIEPAEQFKLPVPKEQRREYLAAQNPNSPEYAAYGQPKMVGLDRASYSGSIPEKDRIKADPDLIQLHRELGVPVKPEYMDRVRDLYEAATPDQRKRFTSEPGPLGAVSRYFDKKYQGGSIANPDFGGRVEDIASRNRGNGMEPKSAQAMAEREADFNAAPIKGQAQSTDFNFERSKELRNASPITRGAIQGGDILKQQAAGLNKMVADVGESLGVPGAAGFGRAQLEARKRLGMRQTEMGEAPNDFNRNLEGAIASTISNAPGYAVGLFTGGQTIPLLMMSSQVAGDEYANGIEHGLSKPQALTRSVGMGAAEYLGEKLGFKDQVNMLKRAAGGNWRDFEKQFVKTMAEQIAGEEGTTLAQFGIDKSRVGLNPEATAQDLFKQVKDTLHQTVIQTALMGAPGSAAAVHRRLQESDARHDQPFADAFAPVRETHESRAIYDDTIKTPLSVLRTDPEFRQIVQNDTNEYSSGLERGRAARQELAKRRALDALSPAPNSISGQIESPGIQESTKTQGVSNAENPIVQSSGSTESRQAGDQEIESRSTDAIRSSNNKTENSESQKGPLLSAGSSSAGVNSGLSQLAPNGVSANSKLASDLPEGETIRVHGFDSLDVERKRLVLRHVVARIKDLKIADAVVKAIPVNVMNMLRGQKITPEMLRHDPSVLVDALSPSLDVPVSAFQSAFINSVAGVSGLPNSGTRNGTKEIRLGESAFPVQVSGTGSSTGGANEINDRHEKKSNETNTKQNSITAGGDHDIAGAIPYSVQKTPDGKFAVVSGSGNVESIHDHPGEAFDATLEANQRLHQELENQHGNQETLQQQQQHVSATSVGKNAEGQGQGQGNPQELIQQHEAEQEQRGVLSDGNRTERMEQRREGNSSASGKQNAGMDGRESASSSKAGTDRQSSESGGHRGLSEETQAGIERLKQKALAARDNGETALADSLESLVRRAEMGNFVPEVYQDADHPEGSTGSGIEKTSGGKRAAEGSSVGAGAAAVGSTGGSAGGGTGGVSESVSTGAGNTGDRGDGGHSLAGRRSKKKAKRAGAESQVSVSPVVLNPQQEGELAGHNTVLRKLGKPEMTPEQFIAEQQAKIQPAASNRAVSDQDVINDYNSDITRHNEIADAENAAIDARGTGESKKVHRSHVRAATTLPSSGLLQRRTADAIAKIFGHKVIFVEHADGPGHRLDIDGAITGRHKNHILIAADSQEPLSRIVFHELTHGLRRNAPHIYGQLVRNLREHYSPIAVAKHLAERGYDSDLPSPNDNPEHFSDENRNEEEWVADHLSDMIHDPEALQALAERMDSQKAGSGKTFLQHLKDFYEGLIARLKGEGFGTEAAVAAKHLRKSRDAVVEALAAYHQHQSAKTDASAAGAQESNDDWLSELFATEKADAKDAGDDLSGLVQDLRDFSDQKLEEANDWNSRKYKSNNRSIDLEGDGTKRNETASVSGLNELRRNRRVASLQQQAQMASNLANRIERGRDVRSEISKIIRGVDERIALDGKPTIGTSRNDQIESAISSELLGDKRGGYGRGSVAHIVLSAYESGIDIPESKRREEKANTKAIPAVLLSVNDLTSAKQLASSKNWKKGRDLKIALDERMNEAAKAAKVNLKSKDDFAKDYLIDLAVRDANEAMKVNANAVGWYDETVKEALDIMSQVHPELKTDPQAKFAFIWATAVTSNGLKVDKNFELAEAAYNFYKQNGRMPTNIGIGTAAGPINAALEQFNTMMNKYGFDALQKFMTTKHSVRDIQKMHDMKAGGEGMDTLVYGSAILGPKIGNGFFSNLYGNFDQLTMDRWLMRTFGRWTGNLVTIDADAIKLKRQKLRGLLRMMTPQERKQFKETTGVALNLDSSIDALSLKIAKASMEKKLREAMNKVGARSSQEFVELLGKEKSNSPRESVGAEIRKMGNGLAKDLDGQNEAPKGAEDRNFIRAVFSGALDRLQKQYPKLTMADLQALLWYPEKRLYDSAKVDESKESYEDDEAPDYANAAAKLAQSKGIEVVRSRVASTGRTARVGSGKRGLAGRSELRTDTASPDTSIPASKRRVTPNAENQPIVSTTIGPRLIAIHNLSQDNIRFADKMGGLAVPSIGVITENAGAITGFGDITLIGKKSVANPEKEPVFSSDAYTARFPKAEWNAVKRKSAQALIDSVRAVSKEFDDRRLIDDTWDGMINHPDANEVVETWLNSNAARAQFLREKGIDVAPKMRAVRLESGLTVEQFEKIKDRFDQVKSMEQSGEKDWIDSPQARKLISTVTDYLASNFKSVGKRDALIASMQKRISENPLYYLRNDERQYDRGETVDITATREAIQKAIDPYAVEFKSWVENKILLDFGDPFLTVGRSKKPYTLDNIVKTMTSQNVRGKEKTMTYGPGQVRAASSIKFSDLQKMRSHAHANIVNPEEYEAAKERTEKLLNEYREKVVGYTTLRDWRGNPDTWNALDASMRAIAKWATSRGKTAETFRDSLAKEDFNASAIPAEIIREGMEAADALLTAPVPYFEAKPQRIVNLDEFAGAVIPVNTSSDVREILENHGIKSEEYADGQRAEVTRRLASEINDERGDVMFSNRRTVTVARNARPLTDREIDQAMRQQEERDSIPRVDTRKEVEDLLATSHYKETSKEELQKLIGDLSNKLDQRRAAQIAKDLSKDDRVRGYDWTVERLTRAKRLREIDPRSVDLALWFLQKNPSLADGLAWSFQGNPTGVESGSYNPSARISTLIKGSGSSETATHEILHHIEGMMPRRYRAAILKEYSKALSDVIETNRNIAPEQVSAVINALGGHWEPYNDLFQNKQISQESYQFTNPSEYWAVNGARILSQRMAAAEGGVWKQIQQWLREFKQKIKSLFGLPSNAAIIRALDAVIEGRTGDRDQARMLASRFARDNRENPISSYVAPSDVVLLASRDAPASPSQTETTAFKKWFGDSKVVDNEGKPLVVYHGTRPGNDIKSFSPRHHTDGIYFTPDIDYASGFTNDLSGKGLDDGPIHEVYLSIKNPYVVKAADDSPEWNSFVDRGLNADNLKAQGFDGAILKDLDGTIDQIQAFYPEQIKSATSNNGNFDSNNPDIRYSNRRNVQGDKVEKTFTSPVETTLDNVIYTMQDKLVDTKRVQQAIEKANRVIDDQWDPYQKELLYHGRSAKLTQDFLVDEIKPLFKAMSDEDISMDDLETFLWNRHAEERNDYIATINPGMPNAGSGIPTEDARAYLSGLDDEQREKLERLAKMVDKISEGTRKLLVDTGLETIDTILDWQNTYEYYVPLQRADVEGVAGRRLGTGQGFSIKGSSSKRAFGSDKPVVDILANLMMQRERAIVRSEKNVVALALYGLAIQNENPDFWLPINPDALKAPVKTKNELMRLGMQESDVDGLMREPTVRVLNKKTGLVEHVVNPVLRNRDNVLAVRIKGKDRFIFFNQDDPRAMRMVEALKNLDADQLGTILTGFQKVTQWFASVNTQWNPIFGVVNVTRDLGAGALNLTSTQIAGKEAQVLSHVMPAISGIYRDLRADRAGKARSNNEWSVLWERFQRVGGKTGYRDLFVTSEDRAKALQKEIDAIHAGAPKKFFRGIFGWLSDYNETLENGVRLAAFKVAIDEGLSDDKAAALAKNLTVNFNKKGQIAQQAGALYAFFNASVQSTARIAQTMAGPAGKKIVIGGLLVGAAQAVLLAAAGFDDEEPPESVRERNIIIPIGGKKFVSIPMALGFHVIPNTSRVLTELALSGGRDAPKKLIGLLGSYIDAFDPMGSSGMSVQTLTPTLIDPLVALSENRDSFGREIARKDRSDLDRTPGFTRAKETASLFGHFISRMMNTLSGGTEYAAGEFSPTPDQIDYLIGQVTGGLGREYLKADQTIRSMISGEELPPNKIPLVGRFYGNANSQSAEMSEFYQHLEELNKIERNIEGLQKDKKTDDLKAYKEANPNWKLYNDANAAEKQVHELRAQKRVALAKNKPKQEIKKIESKITSVVTKFNQKAAERAPQ